MIDNKQIARDIEALNKIKATVNKKVKERLDSLSEQFPDLKHVQINYFNTSALKPHKRIPERPTAMNWGDAVVQDQITKIYYLCCIVYFSPDNLDIATFKMLLDTTSKNHIWEYSDKDKIYIDQLGVYVDKVEFSKEDSSNEI